MDSHNSNSGMKQIKQEKDSHRDRSRSPLGIAGSRNGDDRDRKLKADKFGRPPSNKQVCVANIPYSMTWQEVKDLFRDKVGDVTYVRLFDDTDGRSKGCGIVEFAQPGAVEKALSEMHRYEINGRRLVVKEDFEVERDRHGRPVHSDHQSSRDKPLGMDRSFERRRSPGPPLGPPPPNRYGSDDRNWGRTFDDHQFGDHYEPPYNTYGLSEDFIQSLRINGPLINRVFVANIDYAVDEKKLKDVFKLAGRIENIDFMKDKDGKFRGRAVVEYEHPLQAVQAISMLNKQKLYDRLLSVEMDKFNTSDENNTIDRLPSGLSGVGRGLGMNGEPVKSTGRMDNQSYGPPNPVGGYGPQNMMGNPPPPMNVGSNLGMPNPGMPNPGMPSPGIPNPGLGGNNMNSNVNPALASLSQQQLLALINSGLLSGSNVGGSPQAPGNMGPSMNFGGNSSGSLNDPPSSMTGSSGISGLGGIGPGLPFNSESSPSRSYDLPGQSSRYSEDGDRRYGRNDSQAFGNGNKSDTVTVKNLPLSFTWENLRQNFSDIGDVMFAEIRSRGSGVIRFSSFRDAERAVNLRNGTRIEGRPIEVQLYDFPR